MTEPEAPPYEDLPAVASEPQTDVGSAQPTSARPARDVLPWLCGLGFLVLAGAIGFVWSSSHSGPPADFQALQDRIVRLEQGTAGRGVELGPLTARVAALEQRTAPDLGPLTARVAALEQRTVPDLAPLQARVAALERQATDNSRFAARLDALSARVDALSGSARGADSDLAHRLDADEARLAALEQVAARTTAAAEHAAQLARIQAAESALAAGRPLGNLPGAPPAVARFATTNPPTEASLRLAYPQAEHAALAAARPDVRGDTFLAQVLVRAEDLVTVRQGDRVLLGDPASGVLARARSALDAGDLTGAVAAVSSLSGPPATAMAVWLADAKSVLEVRAGLAEMAAHA
jgi:hypothetical protein